MLLGDLLSRFNDESVAADALQRLGDLVLLAEVCAGAEAEGLPLGAFIAGAVQRYAQDASDDEWITLMGELGRSEDPGLTCLKRALIHATRVPH
ncbi:hypothetical protein AUC71_05220 [Methyloceanibacter marginalis]|uniref:Uncharacterized protein n=1 Tax=Methyloceanibacter marginalis TaxID=1774971 RepID=A0A1E3VJM2_9HYPH|nr:hypothetical protein [Methyloceanibacter marginalis]ODR93702.1 hypothetical protein AUC71_05220 [Methyloceanibacter marginalis]